MNHSIRTLLILLLIAVNLPSKAGLLSQQTTVLDSLGPFTGYYFGSTGVVISNDGQEFVVASPTVVFGSGGDGTGAGELFIFLNNEWTVNGGWTSGPTTATGYGTGLALSADGSEMLFGFGQSCPNPTMMDPCDLVYANLINTQPSTGLANSFLDLTNTPNLTSNFGSTAALSTNGQIVLIGAPGASAGSAIAAGQAIFYTYDPGTETWSAPTAIADPATTAGDEFGIAVALSADGKTALIGSYTSGGAVNVYLYTLSGGTWIYHPPFTGTSLFLGQGNMALSADGQTAIISTDTGANIYTTASSWGSYLTTSITAQNAGGAGSVAISADGSSVLVGTIGTVYQYSLSSGSWSYTQSFVDPGSDPSDGFGQTGVALSADKESMVITAGFADVTSGGFTYSQAGSAYVYQSPVDLSLGMTANPPLVALNQPVSLDITVTNNDTEVTAYNIILTDTLPAGLSYVGSIAAGGSCVLNGSVVTCTLASLAPNAVWQPTINVKVSTAGRYTDTATVSSNQPDTNLVNNTANASISMLPPTVSDGSVTTNQNTPVNGTLTGNNPCNCGSPVFSVVTQPSHGIVNITNTLTGAFTYTPNPSYFGSDSFTYQLANGLNTSGTATESITVNSLPPTVNSGSVTTDQDTSVNDMLSGSNPCSCGMPVFSVVTQPNHGSVSITNTATGAFTYTPTAGFSGTDSFTFQLSNGLNTSGAATESITVNPGGGGGGGGGVDSLALGLLGGLLAMVQRRRQKY